MPTSADEIVDTYGTTTADAEFYLEVHGLRINTSPARAAELVASMLPTVRRTG